MIFMNSSSLIIKNPGILNFQNSKTGHFMISMNSSFLISKNPEILNFKNSKSGDLRFPKFQKIEYFNSHISIDNISPGCSQIFLDFFQIILLNKMKKYGLSGPKTLRNDEMLSFRCLMPWNRHFISLPWRRKIQLRH